MKRATMGERIETPDGEQSIRRNMAKKKWLLRAGDWPAKWQRQSHDDTLGQLRLDQGHGYTRTASRNKLFILPCTAACPLRKLQHIQ